MTEPAPGTWLAPPCIYCGQPVPAGSTERAAHYVRGRVGRGGGWADEWCFRAMQQAQQRMEWTGDEGDGDEGEEDAA